MTDLPPGMLLRSGLWIDNDDAVAQIQQRKASAELTEAEASGLRHFAEQGFLVFEPGIDRAACDAVEADIDRLWHDKPRDLAYAYDGPARSMAVADELRDRKTRYRVHDLHSHSEAVRSLYLQDEIHRWVALILGEPPVAIQSLYFQYGSEQVLHRDPVVVPTEAPGHLVAAWIALEDISPDCGALIYVPGSHRLPYYQFSPGEYRFDGSRMGASEIAAATEWDDEQARRHGLEPQIFTAKRGQVLLWHGNLRHGGSPVTDPETTRKSVVVHFSTRRTYRRRAITVLEAMPDGHEEPRVLATEQLVESMGCVGFANPMLESDTPSGP